VAMIVLSELTRAKFKDHNKRQDELVAHSKQSEANNLCRMVWGKTAFRVLSSLVLLLALHSRLHARSCACPGVTIKIDQVYHFAFFIVSEIEVPISEISGDPSLWAWQWQTFRNAT